MQRIERKQNLSHSNHLIFERLINNKIYDPRTKRFLPSVAVKKKDSNLNAKPDKLKKIESNETS